MDNLQVFQNKEFGSIRTVQLNNEPYFCMADICKALDISNISQAKNRLREDGVITNEVIDSLGRKQQANFINESNMYKLIFQSRKESAERFTDWVTSEVLPAIRQTGQYQMQNLSDEMKAILMHDEKIVKMDKRIFNLESNMVIDYGQQLVLANLVSSVVIENIGGKTSNAYREASKKVFSECNRDIKNYFNVNSRNNIPKKRFDEAIEYIRAWEPCTNTKMMIRDLNSQIDLAV